MDRFGSGEHPDKIDDFLRQVRLSKGQLSLAGLIKELRQDPAGLELSAGARNRKNDPTTHY